MIKTSKNNYTVITDDIIQRIAKIEAFQDSKINNMMYEHHKKLLSIAKKHGDKEVGLFWNLDCVDTEPLIIIGERNGIDMSKNMRVNTLVKYSKNVANIVIMHNHPRNGLFSSKDVQSFTDFNSIYIMTAVCNDGTIYMMRKEINFNPFLMKKYYNEGLCKSIEERNKSYINNRNTKPCYYGIKM